MIREFLAVGGGGAIGAIARHALSGNPPAGHTLSGSSAGTFAIHAAGPFPTGILPIVLRAQTAAWLLVKGFCGGFTTFSADAVRLLRAGAWGPAMLYIALSVAVCLAFAALGMWTGRLLQN